MQLAKSICRRITHDHEDRWTKLTQEKRKESSGTMVLLSVCLATTLSLWRIYNDQYWAIVLVHMGYVPIIAVVAFRKKYIPFVVSMYTACVIPPVCTIIDSPPGNDVVLYPPRITTGRIFEYFLVFITISTAGRSLPIILFATKSYVFEWGITERFHFPVTLCALIPEGAIRYDLERYSGVTRLHRRATNVAFPSYSIVPVTHKKIKNRSAKLGFWMFLAKGSGVHVNVGRTVSYKTHPNAAVSLLNKTCREDAILPHHTCENLENELSLEARRRGIDTIQYTGHIEAWYKFWCARVPLEIMSVYDYDNVTCPSMIAPHCDCDDTKLFMNC